MQLDPATLLFATALTTAFSGVLLATAHRAGSRSPALTCWATAMLLGAAGLVIAFSGASAIPAAAGMVYNIVGSAVILTAAGLFWAAARMFREAPPRWPIVAGGPILWLGYLALGPRPGGVVALSCGLGAAYSLAAARELWRTRPEPLPSRPAALALLVIHAAIYLTRAIWSLVHPGMPPVEIIDVLILESLLHTNGMGFLLYALVKERLELRSIDQLRALALLDGLTGIGNRRQFDERIEAETRRSTRRGPNLALMLIDVDHFKSYNDAMGHQDGDACLRSIAQAIAALVRRPGDLTARYGGEEFAVVMADTTLNGAQELAEQVRQTIEGLAIPHPGVSGVITISIGVAAFASGTGTRPDRAAALVKQADNALYSAKHDGRNCVRVAWLNPPGRDDGPTSLPPAP